MNFQCLIARKLLRKNQADTLHTTAFRLTSRLGRRADLNQSRGVLCHETLFAFRAIVVVLSGGRAGCHRIPGNAVLVLVPREPFSTPHYT